MSNLHWKLTNECRKNMNSEKIPLSIWSKHKNHKNWREYKYFLFLFFSIPYGIRITIISEPFCHHTKQYSNETSGIHPIKPHWWIQTQGLPFMIKRDQEYFSQFLLGWSLFQEVFFTLWWFSPIIKLKKSPPLPPTYIIQHLA